MKRMRFIWILPLGVLCMLVVAPPSWAAYSAHQNDQDIKNFLTVYPFATSTKLDDCSLCHPGGSITQGTKTTHYGSCDYCHNTYLLQPPHGPVPLNGYGQDYLNAGRDQNALKEIENLDSDGDGYTNIQEIDALTFPGDKNDYPGLIPAPTVLLTQDQIEKLPKYKEFLLMNASKDQDWYAEYAGVKIKDLLKNVKFLPAATQITVFAPDGFSKTFPIDAPDPQTPSSIQYDVMGPYPKGTYYAGLNFVTYPVHPTYPDQHVIPNQLYLLLAYLRDGEPLTIGMLQPDPKNPGTLVLNGEGPYRLVNPQKIAGSPDHPSTASPVGDGYDYDKNKDHNAGTSVRSVTAIRVEPLPAGTTDFGWTEGGWNLVDQGKLVIYGAIAPKTYLITGKVLDVHGNPVEDVQISFGLLSMGQVGKSTSDSKGKFQEGLPAGEYVITPFKVGYTFEPATVQINLKKGLKKNFTAHPTP
jgi:hypothetical protein